MHPRMITLEKEVECSSCLGGHKIKEGERVLYFQTKNEKNEVIDQHICIDQAKDIKNRFQDLELEKGLRCSRCGKAGGAIVSHWSTRSLEDERFKNLMHPFRGFFPGTEVEDDHAMTETRLCLNCAEHWEMTFVANIPEEDLLKYDGYKFNMLQSHRLFKRLLNSKKDDK